MVKLGFFNNNTPYDRWVIVSFSCHSEALFLSVLNKIPKVKTTEGYLAISIKGHGKQITSHVTANTGINLSEPMADTLRHNIQQFEYVHVFQQL